MPGSADETGAATYRPLLFSIAYGMTGSVGDAEDIPAKQVGREEIRAGGERLQDQWEFFVQTTHPGVIQLDGGTATGRAYIQELARACDGRQGLNYAIYHDRYQRTPDGWKFAERVCEVRYLDTTPLAGSAPGAAEGDR